MPKAIKYNDYPFEDIVKAAEQVIADGGTVYQKFTCAGCGNRLTCDNPNTFTEMGTCDNCPAITNIKAQGCNYMAVYRVTRTK